MFCGEKLLISYLRPSNIDAARHAWAILSLLVKRFRQVWPGVKIIFRGDSGFCRWRMLYWCDNNAVSYITGVAKNSRLNDKASALIEKARSEHEASGEKQRLFSEISYSAYTWDKERRILVKAEHSDQGSNPRYVVTNLSGDPQKLYDEVYCARGDMENRIKEQQLGLFSDRTSCTKWWANQFRVMLSSLAYVLLQTLRSVALKGTMLAHAQCCTIRVKLMKIGAVILRNTRRIVFHLSSACPYQKIFHMAVKRLSTA